MAQATDNDAADGDVGPRILSFITDDELALDPVVADFQKKPIAQIHAYLREEGIDPEPTIRAVKALVQEKLRARRSVHIDGILMMWAVIALAVRSRMLLNARPSWNGRAAPFGPPS